MEAQWVHLLARCSDVEQVGPGGALTSVGVEVEEDRAEDREEDSPGVRGWLRRLYPSLLRCGTVAQGSCVIGRGRQCVAEGVPHVLPIRDEYQP